MANTLQIGAIVVTGIVLLFCIISTSTDYWFKSEFTFITTGKTESHSGLWKDCTNSKCKTIEPGDGTPGAKLKTVRAFAILAILAYFTAFIALALTLVKKILVVLALFAVPFGTLSQLIAMSVYTDLFSELAKEDYAEYGYSFILGWIALPIALASCGLTLAMKFYKNGE